MFLACSEALGTVSRILPHYTLLYVLWIVYVYTFLLSLRVWQREEERERKGKSCCEWRYPTPSPATQSPFIHFSFTLKIQRHKRLGAESRGNRTLGCWRGMSTFTFQFYIIHSSISFFFFDFLSRPRVDPALVRVLVYICNRQMTYSRKCVTFKN